MALGLGTTSSTSSLHSCSGGTYSTFFTLAWDSSTSSIGLRRSKVSCVWGWMMILWRGQRSFMFFFCRSLVISSTSSCMVLIDASRRSSTCVRSAMGQSHMCTEPLEPSRAWKISSVMCGHTGARSLMAVMRASWRVK